ncbi:UBA/THIF-type NAD/FAD binding protein [Desulfobulbus propionicus DSM 2032]|jgi:sulfur carrier protein ThiS adenylyltransferase|uniref:UBA/THIF-type NAD/FAD binding protein n=1 Tax=Desulfobulbus propionicus (strain ATCC 33891 / DSM 2032 / VKM B-1956 / 1pr3) TaxID=577650 RepID=A0A7U3YMF4_DESPD|nr:sulfur carrier protein ThiS adenylyltransferase ThiF [Desulfobulbus propionicus]ADW18075.1 UBA/THIF-type NAD/FAD binding protein [Desulfobulbus propionicus DSM 2032]
MNIGIAGVGGIGSNVAVNLVRSGVEALTIVDFDRVEPSNLNRQFYFADQIGRYKVDALRENLQRIRPELRVETTVERIDAANCLTLFADCDLIVEGFDRQADKKMLLEAFGTERIVVSACGIAGSDLGSIRIRRIGNCHIVGDFTTDCSEAPLFAHKVLTVANHMSAIILSQPGVLHET